MQALSVLGVRAGVDISGYAYLRSCEDHKKVDYNHNLHSGQNLRKFYLRKVTLNSCILLILHGFFVFCIIVLLHY